VLNTIIGHFTEESFAQNTKTVETQATNVQFRNVHNYDSGYFVDESSEAITCTGSDN